MSVVIYNPLPQTLRHYCAELVETIERTGRTSVLVESETEGLTGLRKARALLRHIRTSRRLRREIGTTIVVWPLLGWLELWLWRQTRMNRSLVVIHDPEPLRRQLGLGTAAAVIARLSPRRRRPTIVSHSGTATAVIMNVAAGFAIEELPHPVTAWRTSGRAKAATPVLTVLGQNKPTRNVSLLADLPALLSGWNLRIVGRGWPSIEGWTRIDGFVEEDVLEEEIDNASVVLVPYAKYFQSGIAVRAVERGTPVVGSSSPFLSQLLSTSADSLVDADAPPEAWARAVLLAAGTNMRVAHEKFSELADSSWTRALNGIPAVHQGKSHA